TRLGPGEWAVRPHDIVRFGNVTIVVDNLNETCDEDEHDTSCPIENMQVAAIGKRSWEEAFSFAFQDEKGPRPGEQLQALLRAGLHLVHLDSEEELLHTILGDAVATLKAQRGAIVLSDGPD